MGRKLDDLAGKHFGRLVVLKRVENDKHGSTRWLCHCECGNEKIISGSNLRGGKTKSCGCFNNERIHEKRADDLTGQKFGRLTVIKRVGTRSGDTAWLCGCDCGKEITTLGGNLCSGNTKSCGCLHREIVSLPLGVAAFHKIVYSMKSNARKRNLKWYLTEEQVACLTKQPCYYCGAEPSQVCGDEKMNGAYIYNGLDRVDNEEGYTIDNVVPCCGACNWAKRSMTSNEFASWIVDVYKHFANKRLLT